MSIAPIALTPLEPGQRWVMTAYALVPALVLTAGAVAGGWFLEVETGWPMWLVTAPLGLIALWSVIAAPARRWRAWGWALAENELHVAWGVWTEVHTIVPLARVQHLDVAQGPIERSFGVARLIVHTAGTEHATVVLPGITRATAEALRDTIRQHIRADPW